MFVLLLKWDEFLFCVFFFKQPQIIQSLITAKSEHFVVLIKLHLLSGMY